MPGLNRSPHLKEATMPIQERLLYASENGDRWSLARNSDTGQVFVRHRPNLPSGGPVSDIPGDREPST